MSPAGWTMPMLATAAAAPPDTEGWVFEQKLDGHRWIGVRRGDTVRLFTRRGVEVRNPHVVAALRMQEATHFVVDGELVAGQFGGTDDHGYHVFDLLELDGESMRTHTTLERKDILFSRFAPIGVLKLVDHHPDGVALFDEARRRGWEGIIAKRSDAAYAAGRSRSWLKVKCIQNQELVIGGFTVSENRTGLRAVLVGYHDESGLRFAGKVGSGFTDPMLVALRHGLDQIEIETSPFVDRVREKRLHWVKPLLVCQVQFLHWTVDGRLRNPSFKGLRSDKPAGEVVRESYGGPLED